MTNKIHFSPMFACSYALLPCILDLESVDCLLSSALCPLPSANWILIPNIIMSKDLRACKSLYKCRETFTNVMSALQIHLFMQNKAKFRKVKLNVNKVLIKDYEQKDTWSIRKKQSQTNPIQTQFKPNINQIQSQYRPNSNPNKPNL